jgi:hypothetical protein
VCVMEGAVKRRLLYQRTWMSQKRNCTSADFVARDRNERACRGGILCRNWHRAGTLLQYWDGYCSKFVSDAKACAFCGKFVFGGKHSMHGGTFKKVAGALNQSPPILSTNPFLETASGSLVRCTHARKHCEHLWCCGKCGKMEMRCMRSDHNPKLDSAYIENLLRCGR